MQHGLIAATVDQSIAIGWIYHVYGNEYKNTGATGAAIGTGLSNTNTIITSQGETATRYAAGLARAYNGGGYTDWYLPSKDELDKFYLYRTAIGGFTVTGNSKYWSSTEFGTYYAWLQNFTDGVQSQYSSKQIAICVRAIRAF